MTQTSQFERERAKRLCAAILSSLSGNSLQSEYKRIGNRPLSPRWNEWAEEITRELSNGIAEMVKPQKEGAIQ